MGKVVKGAHSSETRYTLVVPSIAAPPAPTTNGRAQADPFDDDYGFATFAAETDEPAGGALPAGDALDLDAVRRQAQKLLDDASANAEELLTDAHDRARALIDDAAARADHIAEEARRAAHADGYAGGTQAADREMSEMLATMRNLIDMARIERYKILESAEPELVRLAMGIAERVLHQQIALDRGVVVEMAKSAISRLVDRETITVRVNPSDLERMRDHRDHLLAMGEVKNVRIIEDQRVDRGGVIVETDAGTVDAKIATQLAEAKRVLHIEDDVVLQPADEHAPFSAARAS